MVEHIRNFSIIAHIDHGKSTLADRFLQHCQAISDREMKDQFLDTMDLERERGITIKANSVTLNYKASDGIEYTLNLIDTPGHVDFSYEVSRSLGACEGALLLVDSTQGVQAQTLANLNLAMKNKLEILAVINKVDLPNADIDNCKEQIIEMLQIPDEKILCASGKTGLGIDLILEAVVKYFPSPNLGDEKTLKALIFDSHFDNYKGVISYIRIMSGQLKTNDKIYFMNTKETFEALEIGVFTPFETKVPVLSEGCVGYMISNIRDPEHVKVGDTMTHDKKRAKKPLKGFKEVKPMVFSGVYPLDPSQYEDLKNAFDKLILNDSSLQVETENSVALGFGFRVGFLGLLHMEIIQERIDREYNVPIIMTSPSVIYKVMDKNLDIVEIDNPCRLPKTELIEGVDEPYVQAFIMAPSDCMGALMRLCGDKRGELLTTESMMMEQVMMKYHLPLSEILTDFFDKLKSVTKGYGSMEYEMLGYKATDVVKLDILLNGEKVDAFSTIVHRSKAESLGRNLITKLKDVIPRHLFSIPIQAAIGQKVIARETIKALRKNVTAKCYGGDITRKKKLLEKQKEGKKKMKQIGKVNVPKNAFLEVLKND